MSTHGNIVKKDGQWTVDGHIPSSPSKHPVLSCIAKDFEKAKNLLKFHAPSRPRETFKFLSHQHPNITPGHSIITLKIIVPPGAATPPHRHSGAAVTALMIEGVTLNQMNDEPAKTYKEGETWYESPGCHHVRSENNTKEEAAFYAVFIVDDKLIEESGYEGLFVLDKEEEEKKAKA
ncbi:uncharacterized protein KY384_007628 [Bacidia gigantensis]|uniref:uncharacterized protein n=1 Tax=Bacidia gigantensis TaxID=2732470 RepID=UPI001D0508BA|nr:uncharacterized protein KY384_007628 [Bacidia gigantensis]KAG8527476.1 hypothetical protein KY384_007628 [Bacidia gigantensis]